MGEPVKIIEVRTTSHRQMVDMTTKIENALSGIDEGLCHVHIPHTTAAVIINENADPDVQRDLLAAYETLIPNINFKHTEGNSDAHFLATLLGPSVAIPVAGGRLKLGTWQGVYFVELDGPRLRKVWISEVENS